MLKRMLIIWVIANFLIVGFVSWIAGGWYIGWDVSPVVRGLAELGLIMVPNLVLPVVVLRYWWPEPVDSVRCALAWKWNGWRSLASGLLAFGAYFVLAKAAVWLLGGGIPYNLPGAAGGGMAIEGPLDVLPILAILLALVAFVVITVVAEETMFRGWIQTQAGNRYGTWAGLAVAAALFGLRHVPADLFYARMWHASPQMWLSRQVQLYLAAILLGLARQLGGSTYASAIMHGLLFVVSLFGLG
jgi:membrane protease YdiL (CAAX protease family)